MSSSVRECPPPNTPCFICATVLDTELPVSEVLNITVAVEIDWSCKERALDELEKKERREK